MKTKDEIEGEEVVEMGKDSDGTYKPLAVVKVSPSHRPANIPRHVPVILEFLGGFVMGMEALENFMVNVKRLSKGKKIKNVNMD